MQPAGFSHNKFLEMTVRNFLADSEHLRQDIPRD